MIRLRLALIEAGYWLRPFDMHLDRRRWRWSTPGCVRSRRELRAALGLGSDDKGDPHED